MRFRLPILTSVLLAAGGLAVALGLGMLDGPQYTRDFGLERCPHFVPNSGGNPYISLTPGHFVRLEGEHDGEFVELEITVFDETKRIDFRVGGERKVALTRVVEEREWADGELVEVSRNYFACCPGSGDVFYFGEDVDIYEDGKIIGHDGAWRAGEGGARPGLLMPQFFLMGSRYYQELAPNIALDRGEHVGAELVVKTPAGAFEDCVAVLETTPLEPDSESIKVYAPGVGLIRDDFLELVEYQ